MFRIILPSLFLLVALSGNSQTENQARKVLKNVTRFDQLDSLKSEHPKWRIFSEILSDIDTTKYPAIKNPVLGEIRKMSLEHYGIKSYLFKIVETDVDKLCRAQYIFIDGEKYSTAQQDSIGKQIAYRHTTGSDFLDLYEEYNSGMDAPDIGWFNFEMVHPEFFEAVFNQYKGSVFSVRVPDVNGLFVVHKTHENIVRNLYKTIWIGYEE